MKRKGKESNRQAQVLADEILGHQTDIANVAAGQSATPLPDAYYGLPKELAYALVALAAIGIFFLMNGFK